MEIFMAKFLNHGKKRSFLCEAQGWGSNHSTPVNIIKHSFESCDFSFQKTVIKRMCLFKLPAAMPHCHDSAGVLMTP